MYMGAIAMDVGYSLRQTQEIMNVLSDEGNVRELNDHEKIELGVDTRGCLYVTTRRVLRDV